MGVGRLRSIITGSGYIIHDKQMNQDGQRLPTSRRWVSYPLRIDSNCATASDKSTRYDNAPQ